MPRTQFLQQCGGSAQTNTTIAPIVSTHVEKATTPKGQWMFKETNTKTYSSCTTWKMKVLFIFNQMDFVFLLTMALSLLTCCRVEMPLINTERLKALSEMKDLLDNISLSLSCSPLELNALILCWLLAELMLRHSPKKPKSQESSL